MLHPSPDWLNSGDTAWQLTSATLVGIMSVPGLAILYAGLMKRKWALNSALMVLYAFSMTLVVWTLGFLGAIYVVAAAILGGLFIYYAVRLCREATAPAARRLFLFSMLYLALLFVAMVVDRQVLL